MIWISFPVQHHELCFLRTFNLKICQIVKIPDWRILLWCTTPFVCSGIAEKHKLDDIHPCRCVVKIMLHLRGLTFWTSTNTTTLLDFYSSREFTFLSCEVVLDCNVLKGSAPNRFLGRLLVLEGWKWYGKKTLASTWGWIEGIPMPGGLLLTCVIYKTLTVGTTIKRLM